MSKLTERQRLALTIGVSVLLTGGLVFLVLQDRNEIEKVETAVEAAFQDHFIHAMSIPNSVDPFTELAKEVTLPASRTPSEPQPA